LSAEVAALLLLLESDPVKEDAGASAPVVATSTPAPAPTPAPGIPGDYGSAGSAATGGTTYVLIPPDGRWSAGFTTKETPSYGQFGWVPTSFGLPEDGSQARGWLEDGSGDIVCTWPPAFETARWWSTSGYDLGFGCDLQEATSYTLIIEVCMGPNDVTVCYGQEPSTQETPLYVAGVWGE
jgi:hypothetical protein